jgi:hypothetical protein
VGGGLNYNDDGISIDDNNADYVGEDEDEVDDDAIGVNDNDDDKAAAVRNNKRQHGTMEEEEAGDDDEEVEEKYVRLSVRSKSKISDTDLLIHFNTRFEKRASSICPNRQCDCLSILGNRNARSSIVRYFSWFKKKETYEQNSIVFEWYRYSSLFSTKGKDHRSNFFRLPYINDGTEDDPDMVRNHVICTRGLQFFLDWGRKRFERIRQATRHTSVLPRHKAMGKTNYNAIENDPRKLWPLPGV